MIESLSKCIDVEAVFNATTNQVCRTVPGKKTHIAEYRRLLCRQEPSYFIVGDSALGSRLQIGTLTQTQCNQVRSTASEFYIWFYCSENTLSDIKPTPQRVDLGKVRKNGHP